MSWGDNSSAAGTQYHDRDGNISIFTDVLVTFSFDLHRTRYGMSLRACGENLKAVDAVGRDVEKTRLIAVIISGALSGIGGMCFTYSLLANFSPAIYQGYGYLAIAAMIFGNWNIGSTALICLIFGLAKSGGYQFCIAMDLPSNYSDLFLMLPYVLTILLLIFFSKKNHPPKAAGQPWDKERRQRFINHISDSAFCGIVFFTRSDCSLK